MQPTNNKNYLKTNKIMLHNFTTPPFNLNPDALKHFFIAQFLTIRTGSDDAYTEILTLEFNQQTRENINNEETYEETNDSVNREVKGIIFALKIYMQDTYGEDSVNMIKADQATILENNNFQSTMLITYTDAALHIVHTYQY